MNYHNQVLTCPCTWHRQAFLMFGIVVAGKTEKFATRKVRELLCECVPDELPFTMLARLEGQGKLMDRLTEIGTGQYRKIYQAFYYLSLGLIDVDICKVSDLIRVPGVGPKTARYFLMYGRGETRHAAIDTHVRKFLAEIGTDVYRSYDALEQVYLAVSDFLDLDPRDLDDIIWRAHSRKEPEAVELYQIAVKLGRKALSKPYLRKCRKAQSSRSETKPMKKQQRKLPVVTSHKALQ